VHISNVTVGLAFLAGLASFLSPCVFSLVPAYIGYLGGRSAASVQGGETNRWVTFVHGCAFVIGFSLVFILLGVTTSALGGVLFELSKWLAKIGGIIIIFLGLHMTGIIKIPYLLYDLRVQALPDPKWGYFSSGLMGIFFSAGWSPCVGPVLGAILTVTLSGGSILLGIKLLTAYSAGLAVPFLFAALGIGWVTMLLNRYGKLLHVVEIVMGIVLVIVGIMLLLDIFEYMTRFGAFLNLGL
jgi:cytochrome c-type biogenesis protein